MKNKKRNRGSHGAISVFLAIVLVPCMVFTCVFGDLSRVQLSMAHPSPRRTWHCTPFWPAMTRN